MSSPQNQPSLIGLLSEATPEQFAQAAAAVVRHLKACREVGTHTDSLPRLLVEALQEVQRDGPELREVDRYAPDARNYGSQYLCLDKWDG